MHALSILDHCSLPRSLVSNQEPNKRQLLQSSSTKSYVRLNYQSSNEVVRRHLFSQPAQVFLNKSSPRLVSRRHRHCFALPPNTDQEQRPPQDTFPLLPTSVVFYGAMTAGSIFLGKKYSLLDQFLNTPLQLQEILPYLAVMMGLFAASTALSEILPSFKELKSIYQRLLIPQLESIPLFGLALMSAGAGIGEETLFRGVLQNWVIEGLGSTALAEYSVVFGVVASSLAFGLAHAITASYFIFAFAAGVVFSVEYLYCGLPAAAFTHGLYDFIAFILVLQLWGNKNNITDKESNNDLKN